MARDQPEVLVDKRHERIEGLPTAASHRAGTVGFAQLSICRLGRIAGETTHHIIESMLSSDAIPRVSQRSIVARPRMTNMDIRAGDGNEFRAAPAVAAFTCLTVKARS